jgi:hypothetical protein
VPRIPTRGLALVLLALVVAVAGCGSPPGEDPGENASGDGDDAEESPSPEDNDAGAEPVNQPNDTNATEETPEGDTPENQSDSLPR